MAGIIKIILSRVTRNKGKGEDNLSPEAIANASTETQPVNNIGKKQYDLRSNKNSPNKTIPK